MPQSYPKPTIESVQNQYRNGEKTVVELTREFITSSKEIDKNVKSVLRFTEDLAFDLAAKMDVKWIEYKNNDKTFDDLLIDFPLFGVPYALKDNVLVEGEIATSASKVMENFKSTYSATVYKLLEAAGAILISQVNLDEWALGCSTENSAFEKTINPFGSNRVPGGSSGGPAAVVGSGQVVFSLGSDTGGSIRQPSAFCNAVGVKPTYGAVSRYGVMALASSLDQVGPITNNVADNQLILAILSQHDAKDQTSLQSFERTNTELFKDYYRTKSQKAPLTKDQAGRSLGVVPLKIGIPTEYYGQGLDQRIKEKLEELQTKLKQDFELIPVSLPLTKYGLSIYYISMTVETAANFQRYDGIRYSPQVQIDDSEDLYFKFRSEKFGQEPKRRIMLGTYTSSSGYFDAYYNTASKVKAMMQADFAKVFEKVDVLLCPTTPEVPFKFGDKTNNPLAMYLSDAMVYGANLAKLPAISIPIGFVNEGEEELPIACQIIAPEGGEVEMYRVGRTVEGLNSNSQS
jgi:aspartyl-tRNA(Asn)/glutamyl-tRNA(Gln) amidotransferase subunit A